MEQLREKRMSKYSKLDATRKFKDNIKQLILENPNLIEQRYFNAIEVLKEIKEEIGI